VFIQDMTGEECREALTTATFGRLACARENQPYVVPVHFAVGRDGVYSFAMPGQKIEWMRDNPRVCLAIDAVRSRNDWTSLVVFGGYEELPDTPDHQLERRRAFELLRRRVMWWLPGSVAVANHDEQPDLTPVFYRINIERLTGRRGVPGAYEPAEAIPEEDEKGGWLSQLLSSTRSKR
jgi:nitroimidazol reductase NimA-like FMN-containing flavoprotein (pyridoxamine 5'-phosphate oxidase superfamily)